MTSKVLYEMIELVAQEMAKIKNKSIDEVADATYKNACNLFGIEK